MCSMLMCRGSNRGGEGGESDAEAASSGSDDSAGGNAQPGARRTRSAGGAAPAVGPGRPHVGQGGGGGPGSRPGSEAHAGRDVGMADANADGPVGSGSEGGDSMVSEALGPNGVIEDVPVR
jgi:hypothetical protein